MYTDTYLQLTKGNNIKNKLFKITYGQQAYWITKVWPKDEEKGLRYGQSWYNHFSEFQENPNEPFPELFYEKDTEKAKQIISEKTKYIAE